MLLLVSDRSLSCRGIVFLFFLFCRLRSLNVAVKLLLLLDVDAAAAVVVVLVACFILMLLLILLHLLLEMFSLFLFAAVWGVFGNLQHIGQVCRHLLNGCVVVFLNVCQHSLVSFSNEINSNSLTTETSTSTDSMDVVFSQRRQIVVNN